MSPDDLRQLAHMLETDIGLVALCEQIENGKVTKPNAAKMVQEVIDKAQLRSKDVVWLAAVLYTLGKALEGEETAIREGLEPITAETMDGQVYEFRKRPAPGVYSQDQGS